MERYVLKEYVENVLIVKINRPEALNSLNSELLSQLGEVFDEAASDDNVNAVIITGEGKAFVAGADIAQMSVLNAVQGKEFGKFGAAATSSSTKTIFLIIPSGVKISSAVLSSAIPVKK